MALGISGDTYVPTINGVPAEDYMVIEQRVLSNLIQAQMGTQATDELRVLRNDQAFELGLPVPVVGN